MAWIQQNGFWIVLVGLVVLAYLILQALSRKPRMPYESRGKLLTRSERQFFTALRHAVKDQWTVFAMVRVADLIHVKKGTPKHLSWHNRISCKHVDFVLCEPDQLQPQLAIELDDPSHQRPDRQRRDEFLNQAFQDAGFPLLRIPTSSDYDVDQIRDRVKQMLGS